MENSTTPRKAILMAAVYVVITCVLGVGVAQYMRWGGTVWLTSAGAFWPIVCFVSSVTVLITLVVSPSKDRFARAWCWLMLTWTWLYFPLWLTAREIPQSSAVVPTDGRVLVASDRARQPSDKVWLLTGRATDKIIRNV